ncbi:MAG: hypothetical protein K2H13_03475 [Eubacterium sp.]|nr:hypothetical protein [Eubacterium sp.]MDE6767824.1 hypothetical protein [Eubacterium sp.]
MDNLNDIINSLSADDINMLKGVASSILGEETQKSAPPAQQNNNLLGDLSNISNNMSGDTMSGLTSALSLGSGLDGIDFEMIMKAKTIFEKMNNTKSKNADLIMALKPHLDPKTQNKADQALRILQLFEVLPLLKELF